MHTHHPQRSRFRRGSRIVPRRGDSLDELLLIPIGVGFRQKNRLLVRLHGELWRPYVRNPDLQRSQTTLTHPAPMLANPVPYRHAHMLHVTVRAAQGVQPDPVDSFPAANYAAVGAKSDRVPIQRPTRVSGSCGIPAATHRPSSVTPTECRRPAAIRLLACVVVLQNSALPATSSARHRSHAARL